MTEALGDLHDLPPRLTSRFEAVLRSASPEAEHKALLSLGASIVVYLYEVSRADSRRRMAREEGGPLAEIWRSAEETEARGSVTLGARVTTLIRAAGALRGGGFDPVIHLDLRKKVAGAPARFRAFWDALADRLAELRGGRGVAYEGLGEGASAKTSWSGFLDAFVHARNLYSHDEDIELRHRKVDFTPDDRYCRAINPPLRAALEELLAALAETARQAPAGRVERAIEARDGSRSVAVTWLRARIEAPVEIPDPEKTMLEGQYWLFAADGRTPLVQIRPHAVVAAEVEGEGEPEALRVAPARARPGRSRQLLLAVAAAFLIVAVLVTARLIDEEDSTPGAIPAKAASRPAALELDLGLYTSELASEPLGPESGPLAADEDYFVRIEGRLPPRLLLAVVGARGAPRAWSAAELVAAGGGWERRGDYRLAGAWTKPSAGGETLLVFSLGDGQDSQDVLAALARGGDGGDRAPPAPAHLLWTVDGVVAEPDPNAGVASPAVPAWAAGLHARLVEASLSFCGRSYPVAPVKGHDEEDG